ncbi:MAG TPA: MFS transporter [Gemmataceae bacterium]|nr:MFS transporter [Gemmataceae bacterium]
MATPVPTSRRTLAVLCLASMGWAFSFALGVEVAPLWLRDAGFSPKAIGLNTSVYYLGVAVASLFVPRLMGRSGRRCVVAGMLIDALVTALLPWAGGAPGWFALRAVAGAATAMSLIPMETLVNHNAPPERRARDFGVYALGVALGVGLGSLPGPPLYALSRPLPFVLGGLAALAAAALAWRGLPAGGRYSEEKVDDTPLSLRTHSLSFGTAWAQGVLEGGMLTFLPLYLLGLGYAAEAVSWLLGGLFLGVVVCQVPVGWLADRLGKLPLLLACHGVLAVGLLLAPSWRSPVPLWAGVFVLGACCGAQYPLGLALLGERVPAEALARANAWYLACNCAGSMTGPALMGLVIERFGPGAEFPAGAAALALVVASWAVCGRRGALARRGAVAAAPVGRVQWRREPFAGQRP